MSDRAILLLPSEHPRWQQVIDTIHKTSGLCVAGCVATRGDVLRVAKARSLAAVVAGRTFEGESVMNLYGWLRSKLPLTSFAIVADDYDPDELLALSDYGIGSYLLWRNLSAAGLAAALTLIADGHAVVVSNPVANAYREAERFRLQHVEPPPVLTDRERQVLRGLAEGLTQDAVARLLGIDARTVNRDVASLRVKLRADSFAQLMIRATQVGLVP